MAIITERELEEELKKIEDNRRELIRKIKIIRIYGITLLFWLAGTAALLIASFFHSGITTILDLFLYIGNIVAIAFMVHLFPPKESSWGHKLLMIVCIGINLLSMCSFIFEYIL